jgi:hypothetical protein
MTTEEGNKLIAEFMGLKAVRPFKDIGHPEVWAWETPTNSPLYRVANGNDLENIYFHSSWDWLMPCVEKIESLGCIVEIWLCLGKGCRIIKGSFKVPTMTIANTESNSTIEAVWQAVIQYIEWYNQSKNTQS